MFVAGDPPPDVSALLGNTSLERIVCADGGLAHCLTAGLKPDCLIGDFDSVDADMLAWPEVANAERITHPTDKDASDLELCLEYLAQENFGQSQVIILGASGGRTDHHLFNWLLPASRQWPFQLRLIDHAVDARLVTPEWPAAFECAVGDTVSLLPLGEVRGIYSEGLQYALCDDSLRFGSTRGLSNVAVGEEVVVSVGEGVLLVMRVRG